MDAEHIAETLGRLDEKMDAMLERQQRVEAKVDYTNGRVRGLELFKARAMGVVAVGIFASPFVLPLLLSH